MDKIIILGGGSHSKVVADIIIQNREFEISGLISEDSTGFWEIPIIGTDHDLHDIYIRGIKKAFVGIGNNRIRKKLQETLRNIGFELITVVSSKAVLSDKCKIGAGTLVMPGAIINADTIIGDGCIINTNSSIDHDGWIGDFTHIAPGCTVAGNVVIGSNCFLGIGSRVIDSVSLEDNVIVGAGAVVTNNIKSDCTVVGIPAKVIK